MRSVSGIALDCRLALRWLSRRRGLAATAIASLALGIGANAAVFSLIDAFLFRPFPVARSEELVWIESGREEDRSGVSSPDFEDFRRTQDGVHRPLGSRSVHLQRPRAWTRRSGSKEIWCRRASSTSLESSRSREEASLRTEEESRAPVAIVSHRLWQSRFAGDEGVLGRTIRVNGRDLTIVGVAPAGFRGVVVERPIDLWMPLALLDELWPGQSDFFEPRDQPALAVIGRLKPGVSLERADAAMKSYAQALEQAYPDTNTGVSASLRSFSAGRLREGETTRSYLAHRPRRRRSGLSHRRHERRRAAARGALGPRGRALPETGARRDSLPHREAVPRREPSSLYPRLRRQPVRGFRRPSSPRAAHSLSDRAPRPRARGSTSA